MKMKTIIYKVFIIPFLIIKCLTFKHHHYFKSNIKLYVTNISPNNIIADETENTFYTRPNKDINYISKPRYIPLSDMSKKSQYSPVKRRMRSQKKDTYQISHTLSNKNNMIDDNKLSSSSTVTTLSIPLNFAARGKY